MKHMLSTHALITSAFSPALGQTPGVKTVDPKLYDSYAGAYELEPGKRVFIRRADDLRQEKPYSIVSSRLYYVDESGRTGTLSPSSETTFSSGKLELTFIRNGSGRATGLRWREQGLPERFAPRSTAYSEEEVRFRNDDTQLAGRLLLPTGKGPHPAVVLIHGAGAANRNQVYQIVADFFAARGIAALVYDKRGTGASTGDFAEAWRKSDPAGMAEAEDALAGVAFLRRRRDINPRQVGLWAISAGGEIAPLAASRSRAVAFLILVSSPGMPVTERYALQVETAARRTGSSDAETREAFHFARLQIKLARTGKGQEELEAATERARNQKWFPYTWDWKELQRDTDPVGDLRKVTCPVLAIYGELDRAVPPDPNKAGIENGLRDGGNRDYTIKVFPNGTHLLWLRESGGSTGSQEVQTYVPGYFDTMTEWLRKRVKVAR